MIELKKHKNYATLVLNAPDIKNALSLDDLTKIKSYCDQIANDPQVRFVVVKGEGSVFCSGAHLGEMKDSVTKSLEQNVFDAETLYLAFESLWKLPQPIVAMVKGAAMGGGLGLVALSDYVIAEKETQFSFSEVRLGLAPAVISDFILRKFSLAALSAPLIFGPQFSVEEAKGFGLVHQIVEKDQGEKALVTVIEKVLKSGPKAMIATKRLVRSLVKMENHEERRDLVTHLIADLRISPEGQEGLESFFQKRSPNWAVKD